MNFYILFNLCGDKKLARYLADIIVNIFAQKYRRPTITF